MADFISSHTGSQIDTGISKTDHITEGTYNLTQTPAVGDWRIRQTPDNHSVIERMESVGLWKAYGDFGGSFKTDRVILDDKSGALSYTRDDGTRSLLVTSSAVDGGVAVGSGDGGVSIISNGRVQSYKTVGNLQANPMLNDGTDTSASVSTITLALDAVAEPHSIKRLHFYVASAQSDTRVQVSVPSAGYSKPTDFDFGHSSSGQAVTSGINAINFDTYLRTPRNTPLNIILNFSKPVTLTGDASSGTFKPKFQTTGIDLVIDEVVTTPSYSELVAIGSIAEGTWVYEGGKIYVATKSGVQTGSFADNADKWSVLTIDIPAGFPGDIPTYAANGRLASSGTALDDLVKTADVMTSVTVNADKTAVINFGNGDTVDVDAKAWFNGGVTPPVDAQRVWWGFDTRAVPTVADVKDGQSRDVRSLGGEDFTATRKNAVLSKYVFIWVPDSLGDISHIEVGGLHDTWKSYPLTVDTVAGKVYVSDNKTFSTSYRFRVGTDYVY